MPLKKTVALHDKKPPVASHKMTAPSQREKEAACLLLCAIAGPIAARLLPRDILDVAQQLHSQGQLRTLRDGYVPQEHTSFAQLQKSITPPFRHYLHKLQLKRTQEPTLSLESLRGPARQALILQEEELFIKLLGNYGGPDHFGWHPDREQHHLWIELLGPELQDSHWVPQDSLCHSLFHILQRSYCLLDFGQFPAPHYLPQKDYQGHSLLDLGLHAYRSNQADKMQELLDQAPDEPLVHALAYLMQGDRKQAHACFAKALGHKAHDGLLICERKAEHLLPLALDNALHIQAKSSIVDRWFEFIELHLLDSYKELGQTRIYQEAQRTLQGMRRLHAPSTEQEAPEPPQKRGDECLMWDIQLDQQYIHKIEARLLPHPSEEKSRGKALSLKKLKEGYYNNYCDPADAALLPYLQASHKSYVESYELSHQAYGLLAQHPRLRLIDDSGNISPLQLIASAQKKNIPAYHISAQADGSYHIALPEIKHKKSSRLAARLSYRAQKLKITLIGTRAKKTNYLQTQPLLQSAPQHSPFHWYIQGAAQALNILAQLESSAQEGVIDLIWQGSAPLSISPAPRSPLHIQEQGRLNQWLQIGAQLAVNEKLVLELGELLELWEKKEGHYLPLGPHHYITLTEEQSQEIAQLYVAHHQHKGKIYLDRSSLHTLAQNSPHSTYTGQLLDYIQEYQKIEQHPPDLPAGLQATLRPYQREGYEWMASRCAMGLGCCLADEMGLGKTLQALSLILHKAPEGPCLIIAPLSLLDNWAQEAARFCPSLRVQQLKNKNKSKTKYKAGDVLLASYGQSLTQTEQLSQDWNLLILDEAQNLKNAQAKRRKAIQQIPSQHRIALSATPIENNLLELWSLLDILNPKLLGSKKQFSKKHQNATDRQALKNLIQPIILRRLKKDVAQELPALTQVHIGIELSEEERALYESQRRASLQALQDKTQQAAALTALTKLRRLCCHAGLVNKGFTQSSKLDALEELATELLHSGHRALIFSQFTDLLKLAQERLESKLPIHSLYLDGRTPKKKRQESVDRFNQEGGGDFFFISLKAGGSGYNITGADYVILLDPWWNPAIEDQAAGRAHRIGQKRSVTVCRMICHNTVEERIMELKGDKRALIHSILQEEGKSQG